MRAWLRSGFVPLIALCAGLLGLGALEYRWTEELARAEQDRLRTGMEAASARFSDDLSREMGRLLRAFRPAPGLSSDAAARYARQVEEWRAEATDPALLRAVYIARDDDGRWLLHRLDGDRLVEAEWPEDLEVVRARLAARDVTRLAPGVSPFVPEVPAFVLGLRTWRPPDAPPGDEAARRAAVDPEVLILALDGAVFRDSVLPALAARHFADLEADVAVVSGRDVLWTSRGGFPAASDRGDVITALLAGPALDARRGPGGRPAWSAGRPNGPRRETAQTWRLVVGHRAGSVAAAVATTRARNLGVGLGILALLGGSAAFLAVSAHRARLLARQRATFVAAVSHELRTPLAAIRSAAQNLADGVVTEPAQVRRYGEMLDREGERLSALVEQTLELSGMLGRRGGRREPIDPAGLVRDVLAEVRHQGPVAIDVAPDLGPVVADPTALRSALRNLIDNALKHGAGSPVAVHARAIGDGGGRELELTVEDEGPGVARAEAAHVFEPFYRGAAARAAGVPGSGLGLSLVRHVAEAHGGRVSVAAGPGGRGAAFTLHLPLAPEDARA